MCVLGHVGALCGWELWIVGGGVVCGVYKGWAEPDCGCHSRCCWRPTHVPSSMQGSWPPNANTGTTLPERLL